MENIKANKTQVDSFFRETKRHGTEGFPLGVYFDDFNSFENGYICLHWHEEVQLTLILEEDFICKIENEVISLVPGDIIFINSGILHEIKPVKAYSGNLYSYIWRNNLLAGSIDVEKSSILPLIESRIPYIKFSKEDACYLEIFNSLQQIVKLYQEKPKFYMLQIQSKLSEVWYELCNKGLNEPGKILPEKIRDDIRIKTALSFMEEHFNENISLETIASSANISRSELCRLFKRVLNDSPRNFLIKYRIRQACSLLRTNRYTVTEVSELTGFNSPSHFGKYFYKETGFTPKEWIKNK